MAVKRLPLGTFYRFRRRLLGKLTKSVVISEKLRYSVTMVRRKIFQLIFLMQRPTFETADILFSKYVDVKGGLILERFLLWHKFQKTVAKSLS